MSIEGRQKISWVQKHMPILGKINAAFQKEQPFAGKKIVVCLHLEAKTGYLALVLQNGGRGYRSSFQSVIDTG